MASNRRLTARAMARALLAGTQQRQGLLARLRLCLGVDFEWQTALARRVAALPAAQWPGLQARSLARLIENDDGYQNAWRGEHKPCVRHYFLQPRSQQATPPLGLHHLTLPQWPSSGDLCNWLQVSQAGLWRLTRPAAWQRRTPLIDQHYRCEIKAKRSGGWRLLEVPQPYLLALQRRVLDGLLNLIPPHEAAHGYVRGLSVLDHARAHTAQAVVLKFDLQDFFSSVQAARVHALFETLGYGYEVARELTALCTTATPQAVVQRLRENGSLSWQQAQRLRSPHLPQGAPTSPALANLCAFALDLRLEGLAHALGARYTRYADDIVLSGPASLRTARPRIEAWVARAVRESGFSLNLRKSRCLAAGRRQTVCGVVVNQHSNLPRAEFDTLKAILHRCVTQGAAAQNREGHVNWREHLQGRVAWAAQLNPQKAVRLQTLFERIDWTPTADLI
jgi:RNA-directed DNA polymerase